ncbi:endonuclease [Haloferula helveola]|uniref:Endonuclease n=1 Tax=Haloferula helveola TaxID=490095 RepID=A0ABM7RMK3_9BACT|nr:endonuclease [Haloferula helveola]
MTRARIIALGLALLGAGCGEKEAPRAVPVRADGVLELTLCSFNVRYEAPEDHGWRKWPNRLDRVLRTIRQIDPDVFGVQEALHGQAADLWASLPDYDFHGIGRKDGKREGEYAGIFWKRHRFEPDPAERGTFWLSDYPEMPGSRTWGNDPERCTSWIRLTDRATGRGFYVFNTHWDHRSQYSRERAAPLIASRIDARAHPEEPVVLLGDFNATEGNPAVDYFIGKDVTLAGQSVRGWQHPLTDPYRRLHPDVKNRRTLHFWTARTDGWAKVDHILVSKDAQLLGADIVRAETRETQPSDHYPVWVKVAWPE